MKPPPITSSSADPGVKLFGRYDANNHILSSIMIKLSVTLGGLSPFTLRLPSLIAGFFLTLGVFWLLKRIDSWPLRWAAFAVVCLHPMLLDFSIAARGYSLSLAFFVWAPLFLYGTPLPDRRILLGLSIASNLAILFPVLALLVAVALLDRKIKPLLNLVLPAVLLAALITGSLAPPRPPGGLLHRLSRPPPRRHQLCVDLPFTPGRIEMAFWANRSTARKRRELRAAPLPRSRWRRGILR